MRVELAPRVVAVVVAVSVLVGCGRDTEGVDELESVSADVASCAKLDIRSVAANRDDGNVAAWAVDGALDTRWSGLGPGAELTLDLGIARRICSLRVAWYRGAARSSAFEVHVSEDGRTYRRIYGGRSSGATEQLETIDVPNARARYVRLSVQENTENAWASVSELEIHGYSLTKLIERFTYPDGLITNEFATYNPESREAVQSDIWTQNSGSLFARGGVGWTGRIDGTSPDARSLRATDSAVFRLNTRRADLLDVTLDVRVRNLGLTTTARTPMTDWDGVHLWLRFQSEESLYYASLNRRDGTVLIKKKVPGGPSNGGTYYTLSPTVAYPVPYGAWQAARATVENLADGSVSLALYVDGRLLVRARDTGVGGPPLTAPGSVGVRADNCELELDDFIVTAL